MGCGASRNDVIQSPKNNSEKPIEHSHVSNGNKPNNSESLNSTSSVRSEGSTIPANDFYQNNLKSDTETDNNLKPLDKNLPPVKPPRSIVNITKSDLEEGIKMEKPPRPEPIAFEVPVDEVDSSGSLVKRHPPRRLRKTIEEQVNNDIQIQPLKETLEEKAQLANERRTQVLHQRVASARQKSARNVNRIRLHEAENPLNEFIESTGNGNAVQHR